MINVSKSTLIRVVKNVTKATIYGVLLYLFYSTLLAYTSNLPETLANTTMFSTISFVVEGYIVLTVLSALVSETKLSSVVGLVKALWLVFSIVYFLDMSTITVNLHGVAISINIKQIILLGFIPTFLTLIAAMFQIVGALHKYVK